VHAPAIDPRRFQDLVDEAKRRIPLYCPEWTDHNVSDPGVMLIELFAWMVDILLYRLNEVPERDFFKFLELIGVRPRPAVPAGAELTFWFTAPSTGVREIRRGIEVATRQTETRSAVLFTTDTPLTIREPNLRYFILERQIQTPRGVTLEYEDVSERMLRGEPLRAEAFQSVPHEDDAFYLGFADNMDNHVIRLNLYCDTLRGSNINQDDPPLVWEFWDGQNWEDLQPEPNVLALLRQTEPECDELGHRLDNTRGLLRDGRVLLILPRTCAMRELRIEHRAITACWVRCRARRRGEARFYDRAPMIQGVRAESLGGTVEASHAFEITGEVLGRSDGTPGQSFTLMYPPVLPSRNDPSWPERVELVQPDGSLDAWTEVEAFAQSRATHSHYVLDRLSGEVRFGPRIVAPGGEEQQYGRVPPKGQLVRYSQYRSGGGTIGNVGQGTLVVPKSASDLPYVKWVANLHAASGGRDRETLDAYRLRGPQLVRTREVAVTRADFESLAREASPRVARVQCVAPTGIVGVVAPSVPRNGTSNMNGASTSPRVRVMDTNGSSTAGMPAIGGAPGHVRILLVPSVTAVDRPLTQDDLEIPEPVRRTVYAYLRERAPLTTELVVGSPEYRWVSVRARLIIRNRPGLDEVTRRQRQLAATQLASRRLLQFIHPVSGGADGNGWPFGAALTLGDVYPLLQEDPEVEYVDELRFRAVHAAADGDWTIGPDERLLRVSESGLFCSYAHEIEVHEEMGGA
jgi:predicted phage baseplate assembly protein